MKLFLILNDGTFDGDSTFYPSRGTALPWKGEKFNKKLIRRAAKLIEPEDKEYREELEKEAVDAWVVPEFVLDILDTLGDDGYGSDAVCYVLNRAAKRVCEKFCCLKMEREG